MMADNSACVDNARRLAEPGCRGFLLRDGEGLILPWRLHATKRAQPSTPPPALWPEGRARLGDDVRNADYFSRTIVKEPARAAGRTTHPEFRVALQPSPFRVIPSSVPVTGTDSVAPSLERKTPPLASRRPH